MNWPCIQAGAAGGLVVFFIVWAAITGENWYEGWKARRRLRKSRVG